MNKIFLTIKNSILEECNIDFNKVFKDIKNELCRFGIKRKNNNIICINYNDDIINDIKYSKTASFLMGKNNIEIESQNFELFLKNNITLIIKVNEISNEIILSFK